LTQLICHEQCEPCEEWQKSIPDQAEKALTHCALQGVTTSNYSGQVLALLKTELKFIKKREFRFETSVKTSFGKKRYWSLLE
jgi:hypothetical protein